MLRKNLRISEMNISKNIPSITAMRQLLLLTSIIMFFIFTSCAGSSNAQNSRHRKPVSTGRNKCGCSLL